MKQLPLIFGGLCACGHHITEHYDNFKIGPTCSGLVKLQYKPDEMRYKYSCPCTELFFEVKE